MSAFESGHDLVLEKGTALEIRLDRNLAVPRGKVKVPLIENSGILPKDSQGRYCHTFL